jgi:hypothetical protein
MHEYTLEEGKQLVQAARHTIELSLRNPYFKREVVSRLTGGLKERDGVFVTLEHYPTKALRGCIGFPRAVAPIGEAVIDAATAAAFEDPRFVPVSHKELDRLLIEVSVLTAPEEITGAAPTRYKKIKVGRDGLIAKYGLYEGLLLPIVAVEQRWDEKRFLDETCVKAGIPASSWIQPNVKMYTFHTRVFREEEPQGAIIEVKLGSEESH